MEGWALLHPGPGGEVGRREALKWLVVWVLLAVYAASITRHLLTETYFLILGALGAPGLLLYAVAVLLTGPATFFWLHGLLHRALLAPTLALQSGVYCQSLHGSEWKRLLSLNGVLGLLLAGDLCLGFAWDNDNLSAGYKLSFFVSMLLLSAFGALGLRLGRGAQPDASNSSLPPGKVGALVGFVIRLCLWANLAFLLVHAACSPFLVQPLALKAGVWSASAGALYALFSSQVQGEEKVSLMVGLGASGILGAALGPWASAPAGLVFVLTPQLLRGKMSRQVLVQAWAFTMGQTLGKVVGALLGIFFLGAEGGPIGAVLGESLGGVLCYEVGGELADASGGQSAS